MEIERVNEHTIKLRMSYADIEARGYSREEIWQNREKGEELFWEVMEEVSIREGFRPEGFLWIRVQAKDSGLEMTITGANFPMEEAQRAEMEAAYEEQTRKLPEYRDDTDELEAVRELNRKAAERHPHLMRPRRSHDNSPLYSFVMVFQDLEDAISLSQQVAWDYVGASLYKLKDEYFMIFDFDKLYFSEKEVKLLTGLALEYGRMSLTTTHYLKEYGQEIFAKNAFAGLQQHFAN